MIFTFDGRYLSKYQEWDFETTTSLDVKLPLESIARIKTGVSPSPQELAVERWLYSNRIHVFHVVIPGLVLL